MLNLPVFDMLTAFGRGGSAKLSVTDNGRGARGDVGDMVALRRITRLRGDLIYSARMARIVIRFQRSHFEESATLSALR
jgi:hypothetical protein